MSNDKLLTGDGPVRLPSEALGLPVPVGAPRVDYVVTAVDGDSFKLGVPPGDCRPTVGIRPGDPLHIRSDLRATAPTLAM